MQGDTNDIPFSNYSIDFFGVFGRMFSGSGDGVSFFHTLFEKLVLFWNIYTALSLIASLVLLFGIIYAYMRAAQYAEAANEFIVSAERSYQQLYGSHTKNSRWEEILGHISTDNPNDWKLAIIEADIMLQETLESAGYAGLTIGDQLKNASPKSFQTLEMAWQAHKVRNKIAHSGTDFVLTKKLAQETITQYKMVFEEFGVV